MSKIKTELLRILQAKDDIKQAINDKGGTLTNELIDEYATAIDELPIGVGEPDPWYIPARYEWAKSWEFTGSEDGEFVYNGTKEYVIVPNIIKQVEITSIKEMFKNNTVVKGVAINNPNVVDFESAFEGINKIMFESDYIRTHNAVNMKAMFKGIAAKRLGLKFDTSKVTSTEEMFADTDLRSYDLATFTHESITNKNNMFANVDVDKFFAFKNQDEINYWTDITPDGEYLNAEDFINYSFVNDDPEKIKLACDNGLAPNYTLGEERQITLTNDDEIVLRIVDNTGRIIKNESDDYVGLVIEFKDVYEEKRMNSSSTNAGGWNATEMRNTTLPAIYALLPQEWKDVIPLTKINTMNNGSQTPRSLVTSLDYLWLPAEREIFVSKSYSDTPEWDDLTRFAYYEENDDPSYRIKKLGETAKYWWLRSARSSGSSCFVIVSSSGSVGYNLAKGSSGVSPCFVI